VLFAGFVYAAALNDDESASLIIDDLSSKVAALSADNIATKSSVDELSSAISAFRADTTENRATKSSVEELSIKVELLLESAHGYAPRSIVDDLSSKLSSFASTLDYQATQSSVDDLASQLRILAADTDSRVAALSARLNADSHQLDEKLLSIIADLGGCATTTDVNNKVGDLIAAVDRRATVARLEDAFSKLAALATSVEATSLLVHRIFLTLILGGSLFVFSLLWLRIQRK
jgi:hypothetical protein